MRIVGGAHRGRKLFAPEGATTRPTAERVREALFDILSARVEGALVLDLYAGTGAVGLESLSRGAAACVFVEKGTRALAALRKNIELVGVGETSRVLAVDAALALERLEKEGSVFDLILCDPPYADPHWPIHLAELGRNLLLAPGGRLVVEHAAKVPPKCPEGLEQGRSYKYGDSGLTVFIRDGSR